MNLTFIGLLASIGVASASLGMVGPLVSYWMEQRGVPAWVNGIGTTIMYGGVLLGTVILTKVIRLIGIKRTLLAGLFISVVTQFGYLVSDNLYWWQFLRGMTGFGASALFVGTEIWVNLLSSDLNRGRNLGMYGSVLALGFALGPLGLNLKNFQSAMPVYLAMVMNVVPMIILFKVKDHHWQEEKGRQVGFFSLWRLVPVALITALVYGALESAVVGNFPIYGLRLYLSDWQISITLASFTIGGLLLQVPIGILADNIGRKRVLLATVIIVAALFSIADLSRDFNYLFLLVLLLAGGGVGSLYALGLAILGENIEQNDLATANTVYTANYGLGSIIGPTIGALAIDYWGPSSFFYVLAVLAAVLIIPTGFWPFTKS